MTANIEVLVLWNKIRLALKKNRDFIFFSSEDPSSCNYKFNNALQALAESGIEADETYCFFDAIFEIN